MQQRSNEPSGPGETGTLERPDACAGQSGRESAQAEASGAVPRTAPGHCVRSRPRRPTRLPGKQGQATKPAPEGPRPKCEGASGWAGQTGRQHQRLGTRRRAVVREQRRAWSGSPGTRSCAPHAHRHRIAQPTASPPRISDNVSERQKVTLLEMKCEVAGPERDRQQGHTVCGAGGREHRATGVAE